MTVLCPKHKKELSIITKTINFFGEEISFVIGECVDCKNKYVNRLLGGKEASFIWEKVRYEYLEDLAIVYPVPFAPKEKVKAEKKKEKKEKTIPKEAKKQKKTKKEKTSDSYQSFTNAKRERYNILLEKYKRNQETEFKPFFTSTLDKIPPCCPYDGHPLYYARVNPRKFGVEHAHCCFYCFRLFLESVNKEVKKQPRFQDKVPPKMDFKKDREEKYNSVSVEPAPRKIPPSSILIAKVLNRNTKEIKYLTVVSNEKEQDSSKGIYWVGRSVSLQMLSSVVSNRGEFNYQKNQYSILSYEKKQGYESQVKKMFWFCYTEPKTIYLFSQKNLICEDDRFECVTALILCSDSDNPIPTTIYYDRETERYFLNEESYILLRKKHGLPFLKLQTYQKQSGDFYFSDLNAHSQLNLLGYSVGASMSLASRRNLLQNIIDGGLMKKHEIINHLEWLIHTRSTMKNMENAVLEWRSDLHFLLNYNLDKQRTIWANRILIK